MVKRRCVCFLFAMIMFFSAYACTESSEGRKEITFKEQPEIMEIRPQRPVKIKLKRGTTGQYSWDLSGDDPDKVLEADRKLREGLKE